MSTAWRASTYGKTVGSEYLNAISATVADALTVPSNAEAALVSVIGAEPIRWRSDGIDPTSTIGHPLAQGGHLELFSDDMKTFRAICATGATTTDLFVTYFEGR